MSNFVLHNLRPFGTHAYIVIQYQSNTLLYLGSFTDHTTATGFINLLQLNGHTNLYLIQNGVSFSFETIEDVCVIDKLHQSDVSVTNIESTIDNHEEIHKDDTSNIFETQEPPIIIDDTDDKKSKTKKKK